MRWVLALIALTIALLALVGCDGEARTMILQGASGTGNETGRVDSMVGNCTPGNFILGFDNASGSKYCDAPGGGGDVTSVQGGNAYIYNGSDSGDVVLSFNDSLLNLTITALDNYTGNCSANGSCSIVVYEGDVNRVVSHYDNVSGVPNCTNDEEYLTMVDGVLSCDVDDTGTDWGYTEAEVWGYNQTDIDNDTIIRSLVYYINNSQFANSTIIRSLIDYINVSQLDNSTIIRSLVGYMNQSQMIGYINATEMGNASIIRSLSGYINSTELDNSSIIRAVNVNSSIDNRTSNSTSSKSYYFNKTSSQYDGDDIGNYSNANALCNASFTGTVVCSYQEVKNTIDDKPYSERRDWYGQIIIVGGAPGYLADANDCLGLTSSSATDYMRFWNFDESSTNDGMGWLGLCSQTKSLGCCKTW